MVDHNMLHDVIVYRLKYSSANRYGIFNNYANQILFVKSIYITRFPRFNGNSSFDGIFVQNISLKAIV